MNEIEMIRKFLKNHVNDVYSINQICEHLNNTNKSKNYTIFDVVVILNSYKKKKIVNDYSYIGYSFFERNNFKKDITINIFYFSLDFLRYVRDNHRQSFLTFFCLFVFITPFFNGLSVITPNLNFISIINFLLLPFLGTFIYVINKTVPLSRNLMVPIFLGLYPFTYGVIVYNEYIQEEFFIFVSFIMFPENLKIFDEKIDLLYLNYLVISLNVILFCLVIFIRTLYITDKKAAGTMFIVFLITYMGFVVQSKFKGFEIYFYFVIIFSVGFSIKTIINENNFRYDLIYIYLLFILTTITVTHNSNKLVESYYSSVNTKNLEYCSNIGNDFKIIKHSKKYGFVVIDSSSFQFVDIYRYVKFHNNSLLSATDNFNISVITPIVSIKYSYNMLNKLASGDFNDYDHLLPIKFNVKELEYDNNKNSNIIDYYIQSKLKGRFFYYKCE